MLHVLCQYMVACRTNMGQTGNWNRYNVDNKEGSATCVCVSVYVCLRVCVPV